MRLVAVRNQGKVSFRWKDYRHHDKSKHELMTISADEFIRRFLLLALSDGFHRIRHYGLLANGHRVAKLAQCRLLLAAPTPLTPDPTADYRHRYRCLTGRSLDICPGCGAAMASLGPIPRKAPLGQTPHDTLPADTLAPSLPASATVAAGPLRAASQSRSLAIASNAERVPFSTAC
ncbi:hypothetical protein CK224_04525 [Mesorhizobium sp. WSM3862]|nr:hypothetical protein CK224_04525 [Mesorhizobium sp. WSM3862]